MARGISLYAVGHATSLFPAITNIRDPARTMRCRSSITSWRNVRQRREWFVRSCLMPVNTDPKEVQREQQQHKADNRGDDVLTRRPRTPTRRRMVIR